MKRYARIGTVMLSIVILALSLCFTSSAAGDIVSGDFVFTVSGNTLTLKEYRGNGGEVEVPVSVGGRTVTAVGAQAFGEYYDSTPDSDRITKVILPTTVTSIGKNAFIECTKLSAVEMTGVKSLGEAAFWYCKGLKKVAVSSSLKTIGLNAFGKCDSVRIYCESGSVAEKYAKSNSIKYGALYPTSISFSSRAYEVEKGKTLKLIPTTVPSDVYYKEYIWKSSFSNASVSQTGKVTGKKLGTSRITCSSIFGSADADCIVNIVPAAVTAFKAEKTTFNSVSLSWKKVSGVSGYRVEMIKKGEWVKLSDTKKLSYTLTGLSPKTTYDFRICTYEKPNKTTYYSAWKYLTVSTSTLGKVKNVKAKSYSSKALSFSWSKTAYADGYEIFALNTKGKYEKVGQTKNTYFSEQLSAGTVRKYKVRAYTNVNGKKLTGAFTDVFSFSSKPSKVTGLSVSSKTKNSISLKWKAVKNASAYSVYQVKNGEYTLLQKTTGTTYSATSLKSSTKYSYTVRAYINTTLKTTYGDYSAIVSAVTEPAVSNEQTAVNDITAAFGILKNADDAYITETEKVSVSVKSCSGDSLAKKTASAYAELFSSNTPKKEYNFVSGKDEKTGVSATELFSPFSSCALKASHIKSSVKEKDGSGFTLNVTLKSETVNMGETPKINSAVYGKIDSSAIEDAISADASLKALSVTYSGTQIKAKINSEKTFDTLTVTVPFEIEAVYTFNGKDVETVFSGKIVKDYIIVWW